MKGKIVKNLKLSVKLGIGFGLVLIIILITAIVNFGFLNTINTEAINLHKKYIPVVDAVNASATNFAEAEKLFLAYTIKKNINTFQDAKAQLYKAGEFINIAKKLIIKYPALSPLKGELNTILQQLPLYEQGYKRLKNKYSDELLSKLQKRGDTILENANKIVYQSIKNAQNQSEDAIASVHTMKTALYSGLAIAMILGISISILLTFVITGPIIKGTRFTEIVAKGDFTETLKIDQKDEAGMLGSSINKIVENVGSMIKDIVTGMDTLASSSTELSAISEQMAEGAEQTTGRAETVAAAAEEMSSNMNSVAAAVEQAVTNVTLVSTATGDMNQAVQEIAENTTKASSITQNAVSDVKEASERVGELGRAAKEIDKVTEAVADISEQTNLLALNATIEAARAGEAGKGFAVVANEIKELARQTADATVEIRSRIEEIQNTTKGTIDQISRIASVIDEVNDIVGTIAAAVEEQTATTQEISGNMDQAALGLKEITESVSQSSSVSTEIAKDIIDVNQSSQEMTAASAQVRQSVLDLSELAEKLLSMTSAFKV